MNKKIQKISIVVIFMTLIMFSAFNTTFAAINSSYNQGSAVLDDELDTKVKDSVILDALAPFVYWVASTTENLVGIVFTGLTGVNRFPWADRILFNAVPMLDVNFFNPSPSSLFLKKDGTTTTPLATIVRDTYFTILSISVAFLTIAVGIAAVKLAITSIASEKAKYKEAITKWMFSIVLIFLMHNLMSLIFWINEQMVEVASSLLEGRIESATLDVLNEALTIDNEKALENFIKANTEGGTLTESGKNLINNNKELAYYLLNNSTYQETVLFDALSDASHSVRNWLVNFGSANGIDSMNAFVRDIQLVTNITESGYEVPDSGGTLVFIKDFSDALNLSNDELDGSSAYIWYSKLVDKMWSDPSTDKKKDSFKRYARVILDAYDSFNPNGSGVSGNNSSTTPDLMASLGQYFKESAYVIPTDDETDDETGEVTSKVTGWRRSKVTITGALLYAIFVFQSIFYFFSYIKRFFYIVVLAIMAPVIVILDFLRKALV